MVQVNYSNTLFISVFFVVLPTFYITHRWFIASNTRHKRVSNQKCGAPPRYPQRSLLLGLDVLRDLILAAQSQRYLETIQHAYQQCGNTFSRHILFSSIICTIEPDNLKAVLSTRFEDYGITRVRKDAFFPFLGQNILIADGAEWRHARAMLHPSFSKNSHGDLELFEVHVNNLVEAIRREGPVLDLRDLFLGLTVDVTTHSMYGESVDSLTSGSLSDLMEAFHDAQYGCEYRARWGRLAMFIPQPKFHRSVKMLQHYMEQHVEKGLQYRTTQDSASTAKTKESKVLLRELGKVIHDRSRLRDELLTILVAGRDTTASLLCSLFFTIAKRSDIWLRLRAEVDHLNGEKPTFEQLKQMQYVKHCLHESKSPLSLITTSEPIHVLKYFENTDQSNSTPALPPSTSQRTRCGQRHHSSDWRWCRRPFSHFYIRWHQNRVPRLCPSPPQRPLGRRCRGLSPGTVGGRLSILGRANKNSHPTGRPADLFCSSSWPSVGAQETALAVSGLACLYPNQNSRADESYLTI